MPDSVREKKRERVHVLLEWATVNLQRLTKTASKHSSQQPGYRAAWAEMNGTYKFKPVTLTHFIFKEECTSFCALKHIEKALSFIKLHNLRINVNLPAI